MKILKCWIYTIHNQIDNQDNSARRQYCLTTNLWQWVVECMFIGVWEGGGKGGTEEAGHRDPGPPRGGVLSKCKLSPPAPGAGRGAKRR